MDKDYAKRALRANGIQTPPFRTFLRKAMLPSPFGGRLGPRGYFFRGHNAFSFDTAR